MTSTISRILGRSLWSRLGSHEQDESTVYLFGEEHFLRLAAAQVTAHGFGVEWMQARGAVRVRRPA